MKLFIVASRQTIVSSCFFIGTARKNASTNFLRKA